MSRIEDISRRLTANDFEIHDPDVRSPSPEPIYDPKTGMRINTREYRAKEKLLSERGICIDECLRIDPNYKPPPDWKPPKKTRKLFIPMTDAALPQSYVSLILGPNGRTQKILEKKTKCKIYIRGRGASRGKNYQFDNEEEPIHVLLQADTEEALDHACSILEPILNGRLDDEENRLKRTELMQLASENRLALKYTEWCEICGEQGHKRFACPNKPLALNWSFEAACKHCGEHSHKSEDCTQKKKKRVKTIEEKLAEFNKATGSNVLLTKRDVEAVKKKKQQPEVRQEEPDYYEVEDIRPPGVD
mmetsp:Transcript_1998/g.4490  ORF Transcript_1998/g.4490 Transcript_1998/m.4490 type:complete len:304 (-) Transcript_1998:45-956(-)